MNTFNIQLIILFVMVVLTISMSLKQKQQAKVFSSEYSGRKELNIKIKSLNKLINNIQTALIEHDKEELFNIIIISLFIFTGFCSAMLIYVNQFFLSLITPFILIYISNLLLGQLVEDEEILLEEQLPGVIDDVIRFFSKYGDVKSLFYEVGKSSPKSTGKIFTEMSKEMFTESPEVVIERYANKVDNVWFYSFSFTMLAYLEDATKEETLKNLKSLRNILQRENELKKLSVSDKKYGVAVSLTVCALAVVAFFVNLFNTPKAVYFFFSTSLGLMSFVAGFGSIIGTIFISLKLAKKKKG
ncbi:MAG: hypothetical protein R3Y64_10490 [Peptostreptococcaceae bacterium]